MIRRSYGLDSVCWWTLKRGSPCWRSFQRHGGRRTCGEYTPRCGAHGCADAGDDGIEATRQILQAGPGPVPANPDPDNLDLDEYVYAALRAGASGFMLKDTPPAELLSAIRVIAGGDALLAPSVTRRLIADFASRAPKPAVPRPPSTP